MNQGKAPEIVLFGPTSYPLFNLFLYLPFLSILSIISIRIAAIINNKKGA
jgi:hypothetical protein